MALQESEVSTVRNNPSAPGIVRRNSPRAITGAAASLIAPPMANAAAVPFDPWIAKFRNKAIACGITDATYTRVMAGVRPETTGLEAIHG